MPRDEHQTRIELINPALHGRGWVEALIREEKTPGGTDIIDGKPRKRRGRTDYLLCVPVIDGKPPLPVALLEAKGEDKLPSLGIQQAKDYMKKFYVPFIFSTNGHLYAEYAEDTGHIHDTLSLTTFPTPQDLKDRYEAIKGLHLDSENTKALFMPYKGGEAARYYFQDAAIRAAWIKLREAKRKFCSPSQREQARRLLPRSCFISWLRQGSLNEPCSCVTAMNFGLREMQKCTPSLVTMLRL